MAELTPLEKMRATAQYTQMVVQKEQISEFRQRAYDALDPLTDYILDPANIAGMLVTQVNGSSELHKQQVQVAFLKREQLLLIPVGLAMPFLATGEGMHAGLDHYRNMYMRLRSASYETMRTWIETSRTHAQIRTAVLALPVAQNVAREDPWPTAVGDEGPDDAANVLYVYTEISAALQMNFDVRDFAILNEPYMRIADNAWTDVSGVGTNKLVTRLESYTMSQIAGLNMPACHGFELGGWLRAYGVGCGILPDANTLGRAEWKFVTQFAADPDIKKLQKYEQELDRPLPDLCMSVIAMFGLFHLNKDHTYRTGDANMMRIGTSWIKTIGSAYSDDITKSLTDNHEVVVRTAPHPFGLAQTYFVARVMSRHGQLPPALAIRIDTTPPPVQRVMIAQAAKEAWKALPAGQTVNMIFPEAIADVDRGAGLIKANPVQYSHLSRLYGIPNTVAVPASIMASANALLPIVSGYAEALHVDEDKQRYGIALSLSLGNIKRDNTAMAALWASMWANYMDDIEKRDVQNFALMTYNQYYGENKEAPAA